MAWLFLITAAGAALRLFWLDRESLWYDEALSYWYTTQEYGYLWSEVPGFEIHPPLYGIMLKLWVSIFGDSEAGLRSLSALASAAAVPFVYLAGRLVSSSRRTGLYAAAFIAFSPAQLYYAQEARPYAILILAAAIAMAGAFWMLANPSRAALPWLGLKGRDWRAAGAWAALTLGGVLAVWMHNMGALVLVSLLVSVFPVVQWRLKGSLSFAANALLAASVFLALWAPFLPDMAAQTQRVHANFWQKGLTLTLFLRGIDYILFSLFPSWFFSLLFIALAMDGAVALKRERGWSFVFGLGGMFIAPIAIILAVNVLFRPVFIPRTFLWAAIPFFILAAAGLQHLGRRAFAPWALAMALIALCQAWAGFVYFTQPTIKDPWRDIVKHMAANSPPGSVALVIPNSASVPVEYYAKRYGPGLKIVPLPAPYPARWMDRPYPISIVDPAIKAGDEKMVEGYDCRNAPIWLIGWGATVFDPGNVVLSHLAGRCGVNGMSKTRNIRIYRFGNGAHPG